MQVLSEQADVGTLGIIQVVLGILKLPLRKDDPDIPLPSTFPFVAMGW